MVVHPMMRPATVTASWLAMAVPGWIGPAGRVCFTDAQIAVMATTAVGKATLERRLSGGWLQRRRREEPLRVPSFIVKGCEYFRVRGDFAIAAGPAAADETLRAR